MIWPSSSPEKSKLAISRSSKLIAFCLNPSVMEKSWNFSTLGVVMVFFLYHNSILCFSLNDEGMALLKVRERVVSDPYGALSNWRDDGAAIDPCSWFGVECSAAGKVVVLNLKDLCLGGTLAPEIRNLFYIKSIVLRNNSFTGVIPEGIGELKELEVLDLGYNNFAGPLPLDLGSNLSLSILLLDNNVLLGGLSPEIYQLKMLSEAQVDEGHLSLAARSSSCSEMSIAQSVVRTGNAVQRRQLEGNFYDPYSFFPPPSQSKQPRTVITSRTPTSDSSEPSPAPPKEPTAPSPSEDGSMGSSPSVNGSTSPSPSAPTTASKHNKIPVIIGATGGALFVVISVIGIYLSKTSKATVKPWATGLSGQLQKAFVTGVPKLKRSELEAGCEDFSNVIGSSPIGTLYKGTLSSGVEIAVASVAVTSAKDWSKNLEVQFRKKIETLSKVNHKNFVNLIGYCEEEQHFTRMMVFEYAPSGTLFEHLHFKESEHLDWGMRLRIAMGMAYCLEHMHQLNPPVAHNNLNSSAVSLTEDYAAKISDFSFLHEIITAAEIEASGKKRLETPAARPESNVYSFGVLFFEMVTGRLPYSVDSESLEDWASDYLRGDQPLTEMVDPTLDSFEEEKLERIGAVIKSCVNPEPRQRPAMREVTARLREITSITPDAAIPKLSPLWWAELEIMSADAS